MRRFQIMISAKRLGEAPGERRLVLGRFGTMLAAVLLTLLAAVVIAVALVLGYIVAGLIVVVFLVVLLAALIRGVYKPPKVIP
jgi:hypothetical protein